MTGHDDDVDVERRRVDVEREGDRLADRLVGTARVARVGDDADQPGHLDGPPTAPELDDRGDGPRRPQPAEIRAPELHVQSSAAGVVVLSRAEHARHELPSSAARRTARAQGWAAG